MLLSCSPSSGPLHQALPFVEKLSTVFVERSHILYASEAVRALAYTLP